MSEDLERALTLYQSGAFGEAVDAFAALRGGDPVNPLLLRLHGLALTRAGDARSGVPLLERARSLAPDDPLTCLHLGIGQHAMGRLPEATALFREAAALMPGQPAPLINLAIVLLAQGSCDLARGCAEAAVAADRQSADAYLILARACTLCLDEAAAVSAFEACVRLRPDHADAWVNYGAALYRFGTVDRAMAALHRALAVDPHHLAAHVNIAGLEGLRGEQEAAVARLRGVLDRSPDCIAARLNLANLLLQDRYPADVLALLPPPAPSGHEGAYWRAQRAAALLMLGRRDEARAELPADGLDSVGMGEAAMPLIWLRIALDDGPTANADSAGRVALLATLADTEGAGLPEHRIIAHFNLASLHVRGGHPAEAFAHWRKAKAILRRHQPFDRRQHASFLEATRRVFDETQMRNGVHASDADPAPVFIVGMPRSGTSLTEQILASHALVHGAGERLAVHELIVALSGSALTAQSVERLGALDGPALDRAARPFLAALRALAPEARLITDKMPGNGMHLGFLAKLLPGARVVWCTRDPRDIGLSIFQRRFFGYHPYAHDLADLGWYIAQHEALRRHWQQVLPIPIITVSLTDWIDDFETTLACLLTFLGLPSDPNCERFYEIDRRVTTASRDQVRRPINRDGLGQWRRFEAELQPLLVELAAAGLITA